MADILIFRLGNGRDKTLANVNVASFKGVIEFAYRAIDRHFSHGDTLSVWRVSVKGPFGAYEKYNGGVKTGPTPSHGLVGKKKSGWGFWYSLPEGGSYTARKIGSASLDVLGKLAGHDEGGRGRAGWWYISEISIEKEHAAAEKAFGLRIPFV